MSTQPCCVIIARRICLTLLFMATSIAVKPLDAGIILVGSASGVDDINSVNTLIASYNSDFGANLNPVVRLVDKIEDAPGNLGTKWNTGNLNNGQFEFFQATTDRPGLEGKNIFDRDGDNDVQFNSSALAGGSGVFLNSFSGVDKSVLGFKYNGTPQFEYYVSKNSNGFSLWTFMPGGGLHPVYQDIGSVRGDISDPLGGTYSPVQNGVSHISFYSSAVPEPTSLILVGLTVVGMCGVRRRRA
jgi:hypothetical protein